jgi:hypothetical protein
VPDTPWLDFFHERFGVVRAAYDEALDQPSANGVSTDWSVIDKLALVYDIIHFFPRP